MIELAKSTGTNAVEFVHSQAPEVCREIITFSIVNASIHAGVWMAVMAIAVFGSWRVLKGAWAWAAAEAKKPHSDGAECFAPGLAMILLAAAIIVPGIFVLGHSKVITKAALAPRIFLMEYAAKLIK